MSSPEPDPVAILASNLERLMRSRGLSSDALAAKSGIDPLRLRDFLKGREEATAEDLLRLAGAFGIEPGQLLTGVAWIPDEQGGGEYRTLERGD
ncbi:MAG TPA: helix-turn-helix transcriptional regulator [Solirubrobacterales bacterium]|jgi:transcriptional regulator with XRE-family HTH domain